MTQLVANSYFARPNLSPCVRSVELEMPVLQGVREQFRALPQKRGRLAAGDGGAFKGWRAPHYTGLEVLGNYGKNHFQGIQRRGRYLFLSGGDATEPISHVFVLQMGSNAENDFWASNLGPGNKPPDVDGIVRVVALERKHWHAGGLALLGDILAVPLEGEPGSKSRLVFLDVSDPVQPTLHPTRIDRDLDKASAVALARLPDERILCGVWWDEGGGAPHGRLDLYLTAGPGLTGGFMKSFLTVTWPPPEPNRDVSYQAIAFLAEGEPAADADGAIPLYFIGTENSSPAAPTIPGEDRADLYAARVTPWGPATEPDASTLSLTHLESAVFTCQPAWGNFDAAAGVYADPGGRLGMYTAYHWRCGDDGDVHMTQFA